jgi:hypothetical protein
MDRRLGLILLAAGVVSCNPSVRAQQAETPQSILAVQVRIQGFTCDKPLGAVRDRKRSRPDHDVWVLRCSNATYRVSRVPDLAAKVEPLR